MQPAPNICILIYDGLCMFEFGIAHEIFALSRPEFENWYHCKIIAQKPQIAASIGGVKINVSHGLQAIKAADLIIIPGWNRALTPDSELTKALINANQRGVKIASICSGAFLLAQCGILNFKQASTHWRYVDILQQTFPKVKVNGDILYSCDGNIYTSAGSAAGIDLCLHIIREDFGAKIANQVAKRLVMPPHREGGQTQYIEQPFPKTPHGSLSPLLDHLRANLNQEWNIDKMAQLARLTPRTLLRKFKQVTDISPIIWLRNQRLVHARDLLETTPLSLNEIAFNCGFTSPELMRHHFKLLYNTSPSKYRQQFKQALNISPTQ